MAEEKNENFNGVVIDAVLSKDDKGKKFTAYKIIVTPPWFYNMSEYYILRRYREFDRLNKGLTKVFGKSAISCEFPKKSRFGRLKETTVAHRKASLNGYMLAISNAGRTGAHRLLTDFYAKQPGDPTDVPPGVLKLKAKETAKAKKQKPKPAKGPGLVAGSINQNAAKTMAAVSTKQSSTPKSPSSNPFTNINKVPIDHFDDVQAKSGLDSDAHVSISLTKKNVVDPVTNQSTLRSADGSGSKHGSRRSSTETFENNTNTTNTNNNATTNSIGTNMKSTNPFAPDNRQSTPPTSPSSSIATPSALTTAGNPLTSVTETEEGKAVQKKASLPKAKAVEAESETLTALPQITQKAVDRATQAYTNGDFGGAIEHFSSALDDLDAGSNAGWKCKLLLSRSDCYLKTGQERQACVDCTAVLALRPSYPQALLNRGKGLREREKFRDAFNDFQELILLKHAPSLTDAKRGLEEVVKLLNQTGDRDWVRKNRQV